MGGVFSDTTLLGAGDASSQCFASGFHAGLATVDRALIEPPIQGPGVDECELLCGHVKQYAQGV